MLALAGGAAMMGRGKKKFGTDAGFLKSGAAGGASLATPKTKWISKTTDIAPVDNVAAAVDTGPKKIIDRTRGKVFYSDGTSDTAGTIYQKNKLSAGNRVPPSMRGGAPHAEGYQKYVAPNRQWPGGYIGAKTGGRIGAKKGGRVTGIAKRGFGRALMKGKK